MRVGRFASAVLVLMLCALGASPAGAAEQFPSSPNHRGIATFDPYVVFPEGRTGNAVYLDNTLVFSVKDESIADVLPLPVQGRFVYYALDAQGAGTLGVFVKGNDPKPRIEEVTPGFYHVVMVLDGVVYKKLYRIIDKNVLDLLPSSKTADGPVAGPAGVVFFHVATAIHDTNDDSGKRSFGLKLHLALYNDERTRHLNFLITNDRPDLKLTWVDDSHIEVTLADGRTETLALEQFQ
ncbi:MAG TPA: hypothetical protein VKB51_14995 [bacterium]|nr:hypothetical protein [bacterium]